MAIELPVETRGKCEICGKRAILGDGLCMDCHDSSIPETSQVSQEIMVRNLTLKKLNDAGASYRKIAAIYGLRQCTVKKIILNMRRSNSEPGGEICLGEE